MCEFLPFGAISPPPPFGVPHPVLGTIIEGCDFYNAAPYSWKFCSLNDSNGGRDAEIPHFRGKLISISPFPPDLLRNLWSNNFSSGPLSSCKISSLCGKRSDHGTALSPTYLSTYPPTWEPTTKRYQKMPIAYCDADPAIAAEAVSVSAQSVFQFKWGASYD